MKFPRQLLHELAAFIGIEHNSTNHVEKFVASSGALISLLMVSLVATFFISGPAASLMIASMGASVVLLFVVPHGALSQPWPVIISHLLSAVIGVSCRLLFPEHVWTPALAVCLAIVAMQYLRCVHPPGGATALTATIGGPEVEALGYWFVVSPVLFNVTLIMVIAFVFNNLVPGRRYPAHLMRLKPGAAPAATTRQLQITQEDFEAAMQQMNTFIDVTTDDLIELVELATKHSEEQHAHPENIKLQHCYSNGRLGRLWSVRQVIDQAVGIKNRRDKVIYKILAGDNIYTTAVCEYEEFRQWARFEVVSQNGRWVRISEA
ncbi:MAG: HPP family protein [Pseudomonadota bacterium]